MNAIQQFGLVVVGQVTAVSVVAVLLMLLARRNAARRHSVGLLGLVIVLSSPLMTLVLPQTAWWRWSSPHESVAESPREPSDDAASAQWQPVITPRDSRVTDADRLVESEPTPVVADVVMPPASVAVNESSSSAADSSSVRRVSWSSLLGLVWLAGAIVSASIWAWQHWRLRWLVRSLSLGLESDSRLLERLAGDVCGALRLRELPPIALSEVIPMPLVLGLWRPVIVLPRELLQAGASTRLREVLIHECAHVARHDVWVNVAQRLAAVLWWWHPGVLWLNRLIARSREEVCDNFVLRHGDATSYAQTLLELTERCSSRGRFVPALGLLGSRWTLEERITGLLKPGRDTMTQTKRRTVVLIAALLGALCLLVGGVRAVDEPQTKTVAKKPPTATDVVSDVKEKPAASGSGETPAEKNGTKRKTAADQIQFPIQVVTANGQPVDGAKVTLWAYSTSSGSSMVDSKWSPETVTDSKGNARAVILKELFKVMAFLEKPRKNGIPKILSLNLRVEHSQYPTWSQSVEVANPIRVVLAEPATIEVRAHRENETELLREVMPSLSSYGGSSAEWLAMKEQSQKEGALTIRRVDLTSKQATHWLRLVHVPKQGPAWFSEVIDLKPLKSPISLNVAMHPGIRVAGRLPIGVPRPVVNGRLAAQIVAGGSDSSSNWSWSMETTITKEGSFVLESVPANENLQLIAACDGWVSRSPTVEDTSSYAKQHGFETKYSGRSAGDGVVYPQLFRTIAPLIEPLVPMERTTDCEVTVVDEKGQPISDAVVAFAPNQHWFHGGWTGLGMSSDSLKALQTKFQTGSAPKSDMTNERFNATTDAHGKVIVANLPVAHTEPASPAMHTLLVFHSDYDAPIEPRSDGRRMKIVELRPGQTGQVTVRMVAKKQAEAVESKPVSDAKPAAKESGEKVVTAMLVIRGTCIDNKRKPIANAEVHLIRLENGGSAVPVAETKSDQEGAFQLRVVAPEKDRKDEFLVAAKSGDLISDPVIFDKLDSDQRNISLTLTVQRSVLSGTDQAARQRGATPTGKLLDRLEGQTAGEDPWCRTLLEIVNQGTAAVPALIEELDATKSAMMLRNLGFVLRAIGDKRAVPALIRNIPKTLGEDIGGFGFRSTDQAVVKFMQQHDLDQENQGNEYDLSSPAREIFTALQKLTGQKFDEEQLLTISLFGSASQQAMKRDLFWRSAKKWSDWWETHWSEHLKDAAYSQVKLSDTRVEKVEPVNLDARFTMAGGGSNHLLESVLNPNAKRIFFDLDTGRRAGLPEKWRNAKNIEEQLDEITAWAAREGFDMFGTEYVSPSDGQRYFVLRPIGLRAWELGKQRWKMSSADVNLKSLQAEGTPAAGLLLHYDRKAESFDPKETATFLFITREGIPGVLFVGVEVQDNSQESGVFSTGDDELNPVHFFKGRRFAWRSFEEVEVKAKKRR